MNFVKNIFVFIIICIESFIETQEAYVIYFIICFTISIISWILFIKYFKVMNKEAVEEMRLSYSGLELSTSRSPTKLGSIEPESEAFESDKEKGK